VENSDGYSQEYILAKVLHSRRRVLSGEAAFERDGVIFPEVIYSWPLLSGLMWVAAKNFGSLRVLDFGGSLGSSYYQNEKFLTSLDAQFGVVEQENYVVNGTKFCAAAQLSFHRSITGCVEALSPNVAILSGVLQYLEEPRLVLDELVRNKIETVILDRTPFQAGAKDDVVCIQVVPKAIYPASYPSWIFARDPFFAELAINYEIVARFDSLDGCITTSQGISVSHEGAILQLKVSK